MAGIFSRYMLTTTRALDLGVEKVSGFTGFGFQVSGFKFNFTENLMPCTNMGPWIRCGHSHKKRSLSVFMTVACAN